VLESDRVDPRVVVDAKLHDDEALPVPAAHVPTPADVDRQVVVVGVRRLAVLAVVVDRDALDPWSWWSWCREAVEHGRRATSCQPGLLTALLRYAPERVTTGPEKGAHLSHC
jgi:hypothetical protein